MQYTSLRYHFITAFLILKSIITYLTNHRIGTTKVQDYLLAF